MWIIFSSQHTGGTGRGREGERGKREGKGKRKEEGERNLFVFQRYHTKWELSILIRFWHLRYLECKCRQWYYINGNIPGTEFAFFPVFCKRGDWETGVNYIQSSIKSENLWGVLFAGFFPVFRQVKKQHGCILRKSV